MKAKLVIITGRKRNRAPSMAASTIGLALPPLVDCLSPSRPILTEMSGSCALRFVGALRHMTDQVVDS
jgi:hypothetical protein